MGSTQQCHQINAEIILPNTVDQEFHFPRSLTTNRSKTKNVHVLDLTLKMLLSRNALYANHKAQRMQTGNRKLSEQCQKNKLTKVPMTVFFSKSSLFWKVKGKARMAGCAVSHKATADHQSNHYMKERKMLLKNSLQEGAVMCRLTLSSAAELVFADTLIYNSLLII